MSYMKAVVRTKLSYDLELKRSFLDVPVNIYGQVIITPTRYVHDNLQDASFHNAPVVALIDVKEEDFAAIESLPGFLGDTEDGVRQNALYNAFYRIKVKDNKRRVNDATGITTEYLGRDKEDVALFAKWE